jgi:hypothetical protein
MLRDVLTFFGPPRIFTWKDIVVAGIFEDYKLDTCVCSCKIDPNPNPKS